MSIIGEFEIDECSDNSCSNNSSLHIDNSQSFPLGFADFEQYCSPTDLTSEYERNAPLTEHVAVDTTRSSTLLGPHEISQNIERELSPTSYWLEEGGNDEFKSTLRLSPRLYSTHENGRGLIQEETEDENDKLQLFKDSKSVNSAVTSSLPHSYCTQTQINSLWTSTPNCTSDQEQETACLYEQPKVSPFKAISGPEQGISDAESMQQIPSIWMPANNQGSTTQTFREVMTMPQIYSNSQAHPFRVEMSNDGQQYMIVDRKYLPQISEGLVSMQLSESNNTYFLAGIPMQHFGDYPLPNQSSDSQSANSSSSLSSQQESRTKSPFEDFSGFTEEEMTVDESVIEEQKRKELMQMRRREKNKDCSREFRRKLKEKERNLREGRIEKQRQLEVINKRNENLYRMLSRASVQCCEKGKRIASAGMHTWNKENSIHEYKVSHCNL